MDKHIRPFDRDLDGLKNKLVRMATLTETMLDNVIAELVQRDDRLAEKVLEHELELNRLEIEIDDMAHTMLATQQPVASDLRFLIAASKINSDLERMGDLVININENVHTLNRQPPLKPLIDIPRMADITRQMVRQSIDAFVHGDVARAQSVIQMDDEVDNLKDQVFRELLTYMLSDARTIERALALILISRHIERTADHAVNIAQDVIYMIQGRDVRHPRTPKGRSSDGAPSTY